jgi:hypothetical protein
MASDRTEKKPKMSLLVWIVGILWAVALTGCFATTRQEAVGKYNETPLTVSIPSHLTPKQIEEAMVRAFVGREWHVESQSPQEVVGTLKHRSYQAKATFKVENGVIKILNESSYDGKPAVPENWLENLQLDLKKHLGQPT